MKRRTLLRAGGVAGTAALAGCSLLNNSPPPRRSKVFNTVTATDGKLLVELVDQPKIESTADVDGPTGGSIPGMLAGLFGSLSPVGVARAAKGGGKGKGATGRGSGGWSSAPKNWNGHAKYHGGDYDDWRENNGVKTFVAAASVVGIAYLGSDAAFEDSPPGPGKPPGGWDSKYARKKVGDDSTGKGPNSIYENISQEGWYRIGARLEPKGDGSHNFGWECVDFEVDNESGGYRVEDRWKVSPRLAGD